ARPSPSASVTIFAEEESGGGGLCCCSFTCWRRSLAYRARSRSERATSLAISHAAACRSRARAFSCARPARSKLTFPSSATFAVIAVCTGTVASSRTTPMSPLGSWPLLYPVVSSPRLLWLLSAVAIAARRSERLNAECAARRPERLNARKPTARARRRCLAAARRVREWIAATRRRVDAHAEKHTERAANRRRRAAAAVQA
ncbi:unnamed protein product, partial [Ectocarpus fasciculatus]